MYRFNGVITFQQSSLSLVIAAVLICSVSFGAHASDEWITINKDYSSQRYVDLDQINQKNVQGMGEVCEARLNEPSWFSSGLLMVGRTLYVATLRATYAVDAANCTVRWRSVIKLGHIANISSRGPGYLDGAIFRGTADGRVIALDAQTGKVLWDVQHADPKQNESFVAAPIAWNGKVFIGIGISDLGIRGRLVAIDAKTGKEVWRFNTVPEAGEKSWGGGKPGGGGFWTTFSLDPITGEVLVPSANPAPDYEAEIRPGDNFYTNSVIALDAETGQLKWYYQHTPRDDHDWDLQTLAVIGKDFPLALVREITKKRDDAIDSMLKNLQLAEFIYEQPAVGDVQYTFKHTLSHDVAYNSVLIERRKLLHERVGSAMEASFAQSIDDHLSQLAYHYGRSGNVRKALEYLSLAGQQAHRRLAHSEAIVHLNAALQLLKSLPEDDERRREEASLQITFAEAAATARGPADGEVGAALARARDLCTQLGDTRRTFRVLLGLRFFYNFKGQWQNDLETSQQLVALAEREPSPARLLWANTALGEGLEYQGRHGDARAHLEKAIAFIPAIAEHTVFPVADPRIAALDVLGDVLWCLGFPDQALERCREALTLARKLGRPFPLCSAYSGVCTVYRDRGEVFALEEAANELRALADEHGFGLYREEGTYWRAWCLVKKGSVEEGLNEVERSLATRRAVGLAGGGALFDAFQAYRKLRRFDEALALLDQTTWSPRFSSAVRRVRGELQLEAGRCSEREAEDLFRDAIRIARSEEARSFELLAATSLARLLAKQGKREEARTLLADIYSWFTEGFDTADLKDAKALLDQLRG